MKNRKVFVFAIFLLLFCGFIWLVWQSNFLWMVYNHVLEETKQQEILMVQGMAGFLMSEYPEEEQRFVSLLKDKDELILYQNKGIEILEKYGYNAIGHNERVLHYENLKSVWRNRFIGICGIYIIMAIILLLYGQLKQKRHSESILHVLNAFLEEDYWFSATTKPLFGRNRVGLNSQLSDSLKRLGNMIQWKNNNLLDEQERTKALVTDISHQLKTPIASLKTCFDLYVEADDNKEQEEFLYRCHMQMDKLEELIGALINISRMESAMIVLNPQPTDLCEMLVRAVNGVYDKAHNKGIDIEIKEFDDVTLLLDERWTAEAIMNVLENAIKYSDTGRMVTVSVERRTSFLRVEIEDEGIGIPQENCSQIFKRFYRGEHPLVKSSEGTGVGLYLSRMILEKQGGSISVRAKAGKGSIFVLQLPY